MSHGTTTASPGVYTHHIGPELVDTDAKLRAFLDLLDFLAADPGPWVM